MISPPFHDIKGGTLRAFRGIWIAFMVAVTSFPYLSNFLNAPAGYHYTWILPPYPEDSLAYQVWRNRPPTGNCCFRSNTLRCRMRLFCSIRFFWSPAG